MSKLGDKKIKYAEKVHRNKIRSSCRKLSSKFDTATDKITLLIGDSKARGLQQNLAYNTAITINYRSGAKIQYLNTTYVQNLIKRTYRPFILLWFGTNELTRITRKPENYIDIIDNIEECIPTLINSYLQYKQLIYTINRGSNVIFLEVPYYSIINWNKCKKHPHPELFENHQHRLELAINSLNEEIRKLNGEKISPRLANDLILSTKKSKKTQLKRINYSLLYDGIHPTTTICKLWNLKIRCMPTSR